MDGFNSIRPPWELGKAESHEARKNFLDETHLQTSVLLELRKLSLSSSGYLDLNRTSHNPISWWCDYQQEGGIPVLRILALTFSFH